MGVTLPSGDPAKAAPPGMSTGGNLPAQDGGYLGPAPTVPDWVPGNSGVPNADELNILQAPRIMIPAANTVIPIVYGKDRVFGRPFVVHVDDVNGFLYVAYSFCEGPIQSFDSIIVDGTDVTLDPGGLLTFEGAAINQHLGLPNDIVDPMLKAVVTSADGSGEGLSYNDTLPNTAYLVFKFPKAAAKGFPRVEAIIKGLKVYDPRKDSTNGGSGTQRLSNKATWTWSANPTLCFADFATQRVKWGMAWDSVILNANANDEVLTYTEADPPPLGLADTSIHRRRELGLTLGSAQLSSAWVQGFRTYMGAYIAWENGKIRVVPDRPDVDVQRGLLCPGEVGDPSAVAVGVGTPAAAQKVGSGSFTVSVQVRFNATGKTQGLVCHYFNSTSAGWYFAVDASDRMRMYMHNGTTSVTVNSAPITLPTDDFQELCAVVDRTAGTVQFRLHGVDVGAPVPFTLSGSIDSTSVFTFCTLPLVEGWATVGVVDEIRWWKAKLTAAESQQWLTHEVDPVPATLVGYYKLNSWEGSTAYDASASKKNGFVGNQLTWTRGNTQLLPPGIAHHFTADDIKAESLSLRHRSSRLYPNSILIEFQDAQYTTAWRTARVQVDSPKVTSGQHARRVSMISLPGIHFAPQARREAIERLNWFLSDLEGTLTVWDEGLNVHNGSIIAITHPIGLSAKLFRVVKAVGQAGRWQFDMAEYDPGIYSNQVLIEPSTPDTNLGNPLGAPVVTGLSCVEELFKYRNGLTGSRVRATWTASHYAYLSNYVVEGWVNGQRVFQTTSSVNEAVTPPVEELVTLTAVTYEIRVYVRTPYMQGDAAVATCVVEGKLAPPSNVPSLTLTQLASDAVALVWGEATDIDIASYEVRHGDGSSDWDSASVLELVNGLTYTANRLSAGVHRFFVKARDSVNNLSPDAIMQEITLTAPPAVGVLNGFEVAGTVHLNWAKPVGSEYIARYRVAYSDVPQTFETTLDVVDTMTFQTSLIPVGTYDFKVYAIDDAGRESVAPAVRRVSVTTDAEAFIADQYDFTSPVLLTNFHAYTLRTDAVLYWVTNMGDLFTSSPSTFSTYSGVPLANYHASGNAVWLSETKDFGQVLTGNWLLDTSFEVLGGSAVGALELSPDNVSWDVATAGSGPISAKGAYRYARVRITTATTDTVLVKSPDMHLSAQVVPQEESGATTTLASGPLTISLSRQYTAVKELTCTVVNNISGVTGAVDNIVMNNGGVTTFDLYAFDRFGQQLAKDVQWKFKGV